MLVKKLFIGLLCEVSDWLILFKLLFRVNILDRFRLMVNIR